MWAHLLSPLGRQPHGHRDATPPCPRPVAHPPCLLGTAQGGLSRGPEQVVARTTRNGPGPHLGHPPLNSLAGQDLGTVTGRPGNPLRGPPDKSQIKFTELPGGGGRLEFTPPRVNEECALLGCRPPGVGFPSCAIQCHTGTQGTVLPSLANKRALGSSGWAEKVPGRATHSWDTAFLPLPSTCTCPRLVPAPAPQVLGGQAQCLRGPRALGGGLWP